ncbi:MAG: hypothetical protein JOZ01_07525 [Candidatus Eremiobacteraeota bacterium]|nr:hypothetical protein [Candidatus Eremiobacteraeota bacterium]
MERSAGFAGLAFVVLVLVVGFLPGVPPASNAAPAEIAAFFDAHRTVMLFSAWLSWPLAALFLWFAVQLRAFLRLAPQVDDGLPTYMFAAALLATAVTFVSATFQVALVFHPAANLGDPLVRALYDGFNASGTALLLGPVAIMVFAASHSGRRHASLPAALVYFGYLTALLDALSSLSVFFTDGFLALGGVGELALGLLPFAVWVVWTSVVLIRAPR